MRAIILAAGLGSRLGAKAEGNPKALIKVGGKTLIEHQLEALSSEASDPLWSGRSWRRAGARRVG
jgi:choline kinase